MKKIRLLIYSFTNCLLKFSSAIWDGVVNRDPFGSCCSVQGLNGMMDLWSKKDISRFMMSTRKSSLKFGQDAQSWIKKVWAKGWVLECSFWDAVSHLVRCWEISFMYYPGAWRKPWGWEFSGWEANRWQWSGWNPLKEGWQWRREWFCWLLTCPSL